MFNSQNNLFLDLFTTKIINKYRKREQFFVVVVTFFYCHSPIFSISIFFFFCFVKRKTLCRSWTFNVWTTTETIHGLNHFCAIPFLSYSRPLVLCCVDGSPYLAHMPFSRFSAAVFTIYSSFYCFFFAILLLRFVVFVFFFASVIVIVAFFSPFTWLCCVASYTIYTLIHNFPSNWRYTMRRRSSIDFDWNLCRMLSRTHNKKKKKCSFLFSWKA